MTEQKKIHAPRERKRRKKRDNCEAASNLDLSHLNASPLKIALPERRHTFHLCLVGTGGTGSWLAPHLVRLARFLRETRDLEVEVTFVDPDVVEMKNVFRQNFGEADIGGKKAELLALRYAAPWGVPIHVHTERFDKGMIHFEYGDLDVIIGCVDNAAARRSMADALAQNPDMQNAGGLPRLFWLDCGNGEDTGQVLFGAARSVRQLRYAFPYFPEKGFCVNLPAPDLQHPDLLEAHVGETQPSKIESAISCADMAQMGDQSPSINAMVANIAATYLWRLFTDPKGLTTFATYCNLSVLSTRSRFITPDGVAAAVGAKSAVRLFKPSGSPRVH